MFLVYGNVIGAADLLGTAIDDVIFSDGDSIEEHPRLETLLLVRTSAAAGTTTRISLMLIILALENELAARTS